MLKTLRLENFQAHKDTTIEFSPNLTCIIGLNNHGKSSILRGARKIVRNEPEGSVFVRDGEKETRLTLTTDTGQVIRRVRNDGSDGANAYVVPQGTESIEFNKFGSAIPQELLKYFESSELQMFGDVEYDLNFRTQFDNLFLTLGKGLASLRGKVLSKLTGIDKVQRAVQLAASEEKQLGTSSKKIAQQVTEAQTALSPFETLDQQLSSLDVIKQRAAYVTSAETYIGNLKSLYSTLAEQATTAKNLSATIKILAKNFLEDVTNITKTQSILKLLRELEEIERSIAIEGKLAHAVLPDSHLAMQSQEINIRLQAYSVIVANEDVYRQRAAILLPDEQAVVHTKHYFTQLQDLNKEYRRLSTAVDDYNRLEKEDTLQLAYASAELTELKAELKICPTCNRAF